MAAIAADFQRRFVIAARLLLRRRFPAVQTVVACRIRE
jgi:hypothetical protein